MLLSIIIPFYNSEKFIFNFFSFLYNQKYTKAYEIIFVDDYSTDNSFFLIQTLICLIPNSKLVKNSYSKGSSSARNFGASISSGLFLCNIDIDDILKEDFIKNRIDLISTNKSLVDIFIINSTSHDVRNPNRKSKTYGHEKKGKIINYFLRGDYPFSTWNLLINRNFIDKIGFDDRLKIYTDFDYIVRLLLLNPILKYIKIIPDYFYTIGNTNSMTSNFLSDEKFESSIYIINKFHKILNKSQFIEFFGFISFIMLRVLLSNNFQNIKTFYNVCTSLYFDSPLILIKMKLTRIINFLPFIKLKKLLFFIITGKIV